jgi:hypothetical protein
MVSFYVFICDLPHQIDLLDVEEDPNGVTEA